MGNIEEEFVETSGTVEDMDQEDRGSTSPQSSTLVGKKRTQRAPKRLISKRRKGLQSSKEFDSLSGDHEPDRYGLDLKTYKLIFSRIKDALLLSEECSEEKATTLSERIIQ